MAETDEDHELLHLISTRRPHVVVFSAGASGVNGLRLANQIIKKFPRVRIALVAPSYSGEYAAHVLRAGVSGLLLKDVPLPELERALTTLADGGTYLSPAVNAQAPAEIDSRRPSTTRRQREILELIADGKSTKEIAVILKVSTKTVETHRLKLMKRLKIFSIAGLVRYALRTGLAAMDLE